MRVLKAIYVGYKRLALRNVYRFEYTPEMDLQIIIGTNGSGKTSIMELLTPLPASSSDFSKGGSFTIEIEHLGEFYRCVSDFRSAGKYYLFHRQDDGSEINMNEGYTATAQRELVKQIFGYTPEIHQLLIGRLKFTEMTTGQRKHWITMFTTTDLTFALKLYNDFRVANRDTTGALKHHQNRIAVETSKLMDMEDIGKLEAQAKQYRDELNVLLLNKEQGIPKGWDTEAQLNAVMRNVSKCSKAIVDLSLKCPAWAQLPTPHTMGDVDGAVSNLQQQLNLDESMLTHYVDEYMNLEGLLRTLESNGAQGIEELTVRLEQLESDEVRIRDGITKYPMYNDSYSALVATNNVFDILVDVFTSMPSNDERRYTQEIYAEQTRLADTLKYEIDRRINRISQFEDRLAHLGHTEDTECPKCEHKWKVGAKPYEEEQLNVLIVEMRNEIVGFEEQLVEVREYLKGAEEYLSCIRRYKNVTLQYPIMTILWNDFAENNRFCMAPKTCLADLYVWQADLQQSALLETVITERKSLSEALDHASRMNQSGSGHFTERGQKLSEQINDVTERITVHKANLATLLSYRGSLNRLSELKAEVVRDTTKMLEIRDLMLRISRDELIGNCIDSHQNTLAMTQQVLNQKTTLEGIVKDLQESAASLLLDKEALQIIDDVLSPTSGFIAEQLHGTIQDIVRQLNTIIEALWTYDLTILSCSSGTEGELDYKFPMLFGIDGRSDDVSEGSEGQVGVVNLAFRLLAYSHLKLENFPLYLDETGREFDEHHRMNFLNYVKEAVAGHQFSQAFIISHYAASHGSVLHADIVVMDPANIVTPERYNNCVDFQYGNSN